MLCLLKLVMDRHLEGLWVTGTTQLELTGWLQMGGNGRVG